MKKYFVDQFVTFTHGDGRPATHFSYECDGIEFDQDWTGNCLKLKNANMYRKSGQWEIREACKHNEETVTIEKMMHWESALVIIKENATQKIITSIEIK